LRGVKGRGVVDLIGRFESCEASHRLGSLTRNKEQAQNTGTRTDYNGVALLFYTIKILKENGSI